MCVRAVGWTFWCPAWREWSRDSKLKVPYQLSLVLPTSSVQLLLVPTTIRVGCGVTGEIGPGVASINWHGVDDKLLCENFLSCQRGSCVCAV